MAKRVVGPEQVVTLAYTLMDEDGAVIDSSEDGEPLVYLHGAGDVVAGLEKATVGRAVGEKVKAVIPPEEGYGERDEDGVQDVPRSAFEAGSEMEVGALFMTEDDDGNPVPFWIVELGEDNVVVDLNHPLAGLALQLEAEVLDIRGATAEELRHGLAHDDDCGD